MYLILKDDRLSRARLDSSFRVVGTYSGNGLLPCSHPFGFDVLFFKFVPVPFDRILLWFVQCYSEGLISNVTINTRQMQ